MRQSADPRSGGFQPPTGGAAVGGPAPLAALADGGWKPPLRPRRTIGPARVTNPLSPRGPVSRTDYLAWGLGLGTLKYAAEAGFVAATAGRLYEPGEFLTPSIGRVAEFAALGDWAGPVYLAWTVPFAYVCAAMSVRRAATAGASAWLGLLTLAPVVNLPILAILSALPPAGDPVEEEIRLEPGAQASAGERSEPGAGRAADDALPELALRAQTVPDDDDFLAVVPDAADRRRAAIWKFAGVLFGPAYTLAMVGLCVYWLGDYGAALFFLTPVLVGAVAGFCANAVVRAGVLETLGVVTVASAASYVALIAVAWEGLICLLMAAPLAFPLAVVGGVLGQVIAGAAGVGVRWDPGAAACLTLAPLGSVLAPAETAPVRPVVTSVVVNAPPAAVWDRVLAFPPLAEPDEWFFKTGLAYPMGAAIEGTGVGAVRRCEFSTGTFVEPITAWEPPAADGAGRLAFDVRSQPEPMEEWHPWAEISPPHLHGTFESVRGEFLLEPLPGGRTRLTGTTWCRVKMGPHGYWAAWTDAILHRVHWRVLGHVAELAAADAAGE